MTFLEMQTFVLDRLAISSADSGKVTQVKGILNGERDRLNARYRLVVTQADLTFTAGTETVTLPSDLVEILSIKRGSTTMQPVTLERYNQMVGEASSTGDGPMYYAFSGTGVIRVYEVPTTTDAAAATVKYVQRQAVLSADGDTPGELPREFHDLLCERAIHRMALTEEEPGLAQQAALIADRLEADLRGFITRRSGVGDRRLTLNVYGGRR